jgi:peptidoglycan hydrolase-like protein with peptidoglycan-binding domain
MYSGNMDGEFNEATRTALKAFQGEKALRDTGLPDQETLFRLLQKDG